jgi:2-polyprenyl-6-methoxyphenol hydroxylase-like FAD-dependent oxidoreductase
MSGYDVIIAGAGLGGLCAAAGLRRAGLRALVLERDKSLSDRPQGYRININLSGDAALRACLPDSHYELYRDTSHRQVDPSVDIFTTQLAPLHHRMGEVSADGPMPAAVDRGILRAILLDAAEDVRFGSEVVDVEAFDNGVEVQIRGGSMIHGGLLVAADGAKSALRGRLLPGHEPELLRTTGIYGRAPLDPHALTWLPRGVIDQRFVGVTDTRGTTLALGAWYPRCEPLEAANKRVPGLTLPATSPYIMWVLLFPSDPVPALQSEPAALHRFALDATSEWNAAATRFVRDAIVSDTFRVTLRAIASIPSWTTGRVTFLGDAIHAMSPAGGEGANTAFGDAASLASCLRANGLDGLGEYERDLRDRARKALDRSAQYGKPVKDGAP